MDRFGLYLILGLALLGFGLHIRDRGLNEPDEGRAASIGYEMYASGDYITPRLYDQAHFEKPPLLYWLLALCYSLFGVNELAARLPTMLAAVGTLILTYRLATKLFDRRIAFVSSLILMTSPLFFVMAQIIDYNMTLTFWVTLSLYAAVAWLDTGRLRFKILCAVAMAAAFMTKGPVGCMIVILALVTYRWLSPPAEFRRPLFTMSFWAVFAVLALPWFILVISKYPELRRFYLVDELALRILSNKHHRSENPLFYFFMLPVGLLPWLPAFLHYLGKVPARVKRDKSHALLVAWIALPILMFTLSKSKMPTYILPLFPALAIMCGHAWAEMMDRRKWIAAQAMTVFTFTLLGPAIALFHGVTVLEWPNPPPASFLVLSLVPALAFLAFRIEEIQKRALVLAITLLASYLNLMGLIAGNDLHFGAHTSARGMSRALAADMRPGDTIALLGRYPRGISFYTRQPIHVSLFKFPDQVESDKQRLAGKSFIEQGDVFRAFKGKQRVYVVTSPRIMKQLEEEIVKRPVRTVYRDGRFILVCNQ